MADFLSYTIRVLLVFVFTYFAARILSKKAIAEMTAYEVVGLMLISNVAAEPLVGKIVTKSIFGTGLLVFLMIGSAKLALVNKLNPFLEHSPTILVQNGKLNSRALSMSDLSLNQFLGLLRQKGFEKVEDIEVAIFEPQGELSVIPKSPNRPIQIKDLNLYSPKAGLTIPLIMDGSIIDKNLRHLRLSSSWLINELSNQGINDYKEEVFLAELDSEHKLYITRK